jgi:electron transfer flavoprotein alpha subunit
LELLSRARELASALNGTVTALFIGEEAAPMRDLLAAHGADRIVVADAPRSIPFDVETHTEIVVRALKVSRPRIVLVPATNKGRDLAPRVAARMGVGLTGDCIDLGLDEEGRLLQYKPAFGGTVVAPILSRTLPEMATVRPGMLPKMESPPRGKVEVVPLAAGNLGASRTKVVASRLTAESSHDLDDAEVIVGVGKGLGGPDRLAVLGPLIDLLGAALCTTRDVTDAGWLPRQYQVGLTGRAIAPKIYLAVAIRGAFEHMVGVRRAGLIIAINQNAKAPIFKGADYGVVGDYAEVVPALCRHLVRLRDERQDDPVA